MNAWAELNHLQTGRYGEYFAKMALVRRRLDSRCFGAAGQRLVEEAGTVRLLTYGDIPERKRAERLQAKGMPGRYGYALWFSYCQRSTSAGAI